MGWVSVNEDTIQDVVELLIKLSYESDKYFVECSYFAKVLHEENQFNDTSFKEFEKEILKEYKE